MKKLLFIQKNDSENLPVKESHFLLMDYPGHIDLPNDEKEDHLKKIEILNNLEIFTIVYSNEYEKKNSSDELSTVDIKWLNEKSGLVHLNDSPPEQEESVQLWVNVPKINSESPEYRKLETNQVPVVRLDDDAGKLRVIIGEYSGIPGHFSTLSPINVWDMLLNDGHTIKFKVPENQPASLFVLKGQVDLNDGSEIHEGELGTLERTGKTFSLTARGSTKLLFLGGEFINEAVIDHAEFGLQAPQEILHMLGNLKVIDFVVKT